MIDLKFFVDISRDVAMATNLVAKMGQNYHPLHLSLSMQNGMGYRPANVHIYSDTNCCTWCENMVKIG